MTLKRRTPLRRTRWKRKPTTRAYREDPALTASRPVVKRRSGGRCEVQTAVCTGTAAHMHHIESRRFGDHSPSNLLHACLACHDWLHAHPKISHERGWIKKGNR